MRTARLCIGLRKDVVIAHEDEVTTARGKHGFMEEREHCHSVLFTRYLSIMQSFLANLTLSYPVVKHSTTASATQTMRVPASQRWYTVSPLAGVFPSQSSFSMKSSVLVGSQSPQQRLLLRYIRTSHMVSMDT